MPPINDQVQLEVSNDLIRGNGDDDITDGEALHDDDHDADFTIGCLFGDRCLCTDPMHYTADCYTIESAEEFHRVMREEANACLTSTP
jgi:hypothetical protein